MTLDEFFEKLPHDGWELTAGGLIRFEVEICPVCRVCNEEFGTNFDSRWITAGKRLGMFRHVADAIQLAADGWPDHDPSLRARLLSHCGLTR